MQTDSTNILSKGVQVDASSQVHQSWLEHVTVGPGCQIIGCQIRGSEENPIVIDADVTLISCQLVSTASKKSFSFVDWGITAPDTHIGPKVTLEQCRVENASIGASSVGIRSSIRSSIVDVHNQIRPHTNLYLTHAGPYSHVGSEISKTILQGEGFVSEHTASYLSLVAPSDYPILTADGKEEILEGLPNLTNIGAGTVFANYSGKPLPAESLGQSSGSMKGTAIVYGAFTAVNSVIVNKYGQPSKDSSPFDLLRRKDLTVLGLGSFVEKKSTGRIPAFSYSGSSSAQEMQLGWVIDKHPGILLNILKKTQKQLKKSNPNALPRLKDLVEGTLRLEVQLLQEELAKPTSFFTKAQLQQGIDLFQKHLDGRWSMDEEGNFLNNWHYSDDENHWVPSS